MQGFISPAEENILLQSLITMLLFKSKDHNKITPQLNIMLLYTAFTLLH